MKAQQGFTLLELLVVLMIIALLAGFVGPKLFSNVDQAKEKTALRQMHSFADALIQYRLDTGDYPSQNEGLNVLVEKPASATNWNGPYLAQKIPHDPWGHEYQWHNPAKQQQNVYEVEVSTTDKNGKELVYGF